MEDSLVNVFCAIHYPRQDIHVDGASTVTNDCAHEQSCVLMASRKGVQACRIQRAGIEGSGILFHAARTCRQQTQRYRLLYDASFTGCWYADEHPVAAGRGVDAVHRNLVLNPLKITRQV